MRELVDGAEVRHSPRWQHTGAAYRAANLPNDMLPLGVVKVTKADGTVEYRKQVKRASAARKVTAQRESTRKVVSDAIMGILPTSADFD